MYAGLLARLFAYLLVACISVVLAGLYARRLLSMYPYTACIAGMLYAALLVCLYDCCSLAGSLVASLYYACWLACMLCRLACWLVLNFAYLLTCLLAYLLTCLLAYLLTCMLVLAVVVYAC